ncbi:MAG: tyrosine-type recombinase/integrase [Sulfurimonas sp.]|uniref:tyrosine-type recombinase/integrase n=1 Tax=Sulfurimonas sp. TaxID=2022749 RepID=UPI003D0D020D
MKPKSKRKTLKRIKESVTEIEYKKLMSAIRGDESLRPNTKDNLLRAFIILYFTGLRLNELQQMKLLHIKELLEDAETKLLLPKTKSERKLFAGVEFQKQLKKLFNITAETDLQIKVISKGSSKSKKESIHPLTFIAQVNDVIKAILGAGYTSHSFRQGLITEMGAKGINAKIIAQFIGHADVKTTMGYIKPTDEDVKGAMIR